MLPDGPFRGVPIVLKDLMCYTAGEEVHEGMGVLKAARYVADHDQELARRLRAAGFVVVGRTNTPELGILPTTEPARLRADPQPVGHGPLHRWVQWWVGRRGGVGHGAGGACQ